MLASMDEICKNRAVTELHDTRFAQVHELAYGFHMASLS